MSRTDIVTRPAPAGSPLQWSPAVGRRLRTDGLNTLGISTQTLAERRLDAADWSVAADLGEYFLDEMTRANEALSTWLTVILADAAFGAPGAERIVAAMSGFGPGDGDLTTVLDACAAHDAAAAKHRLELMRVRVAAVHDQLVWWIQHLLADIAVRCGEAAVRDLVLATHEVLWKPRYAGRGELSALERLQISVEGMRGHLAGPRRRGAVGILDEGDRYTMVLAPCGSCGVLRNGDPDSGRGGCSPAGTQQRHDWAWNRLDLGWYAAHTAVVMQWLPIRGGQPPLRPLEGCDTAGPCRWFIYKDPSHARPEHYTGMGFTPPDNRRNGEGTAH